MDTKFDDALTIIYSVIAMKEPYVLFRMSIETPVKFWVLVDAFYLFQNFD